MIHFQRRQSMQKQINNFNNILKERKIMSNYALKYIMELKLQLNQFGLVSVNEITVN